jgi:hypothetical protein
MHSRLMRQLLLGEASLMAALSNLGTESLQGRPCGHAARFDP